MPSPGQEVMRLLITDELWAELGPLVERAKRHRGGQKPQLPDRLFFEALLYLARTSVPWRDLPGDFGAWDAVYNRFRRWVASGSLARLFESLTADPQLGEVRRILIDSTIVRAHAHAAGARKKTRPAKLTGAVVPPVGRERPGDRGGIAAAAPAAADGPPTPGAVAHTAPG